MNTLDVQIRWFTRLKRSPSQIWGEATKRRAPHKPILLLAILDLVGRGVITTPFVSVTDDLVELNELFSLYWRRVVPLGQSSSIAFPFSRLHNEPFWELVPRPGETITPARVNDTESVAYLRRYVLGANIDEGLFRTMLTPEGREALREALLLSCFSPEAASSLREQSEINREAFDYSRLLEEQAHLPLVREIVETDQYKPAARDQGFRRIIVTTYDHRCALCGIRVVTAEGHTVVEAAHIVPWSESRNDDIRNGIALCRLCHWGFDEGMISLADDYTVLTSPALSLDQNVPGLLSTLAGRHFIPPSRREYWPAPEYLRNHRRRWRL